MLQPPNAKNYLGKYMYKTLCSTIKNDSQDFPTPITDLDYKSQSEEGEMVKMISEKVTEDYFAPITRAPFKKRFDILSATWKYDNDAVSSASKIALNSAYQEIIGMGKEAIPLILEEIQNNPGQWFWALASISGENPVKPENRGNIDKMTEDWLSWGEGKGYFNR